MQTRLKFSFTSKLEYRRTVIPRSRNQASPLLIPQDRFFVVVLTAVPVMILVICAIIGSTKWILKDFSKLSG